METTSGHSHQNDDPIVPLTTPSSTLHQSEVSTSHAPAHTAFFTAARDVPTIKLQDMESDTSTQQSRSTMAFESSTITEVLSSMNSTMETGSHEGLSEAEILDQDSIVGDDGPILTLEPPSSASTTTQESLPRPGAAPAVIAPPPPIQTPVEPLRKEPVDTLPEDNDLTLEASPTAVSLPSLLAEDSDNTGRTTTETVPPGEPLRGAKIKVDPKVAQQLSEIPRRPADSMFDVPSSFLEKEQRELTEKDSRVVVAYSEGMEFQHQPNTAAPVVHGAQTIQTTPLAAKAPSSAKADPVAASSPSTPVQPRTSTLSHAKDTVNMSLAELRTSLDSLGVELWQVPPEKTDHRTAVQEAEVFAQNEEYEAAIEAYMTLLKSNPPEREEHQARLLELWEEWRNMGFSSGWEDDEDPGVDFTYAMSPLQKYQNLLIGAVAFLVVLVALVLYSQQSSNKAGTGKKTVAASDAGTARKAPPIRRASTSLLMINSSPSGAEILLNGTNIKQRTPASLRLEPGGYKLRLQLNGFQSQERTLQMLEATNIILDMNLIPAVASTPRSRPRNRRKRRSKRRFVFFRLQSTPAKASVWVNGRDSRKTTPVALKLRPGLYAVELRHPNHTTVKRRFQLQSGQDLQVHIAMGQNVAQLEVNSSPSGAQLWLDGKKTAYKTPASLPVPTGREVKVELRATGYKSTSKIVSLKPNQRKTLTMTLKKKGPRTMVYIASGSFWMGNNTSVHEKPMHKVTLSGFWMDRYEVTVAEYMACVEAGICSKPGDGPGCNARDPKGKAKHPVNCVNWYNAASYCRWKKKRLPSEAQWEKAARGGSAQPYPWGFSQPTCRKANFSKGGAGCGSGGTVAVGTKRSGRNRYGLYDMAGNVWEWVRDYYSLKFYSMSPEKNPVNRKRSSGYKVVRGGSWRTRYDKLHMTYRSEAWPSKKSPTTGFRCVR
jgi:formylglycine-generating enzyme required for sulfatase activity